MPGITDVEYNGSADNINLLVEFIEPSDVDVIGYTVEVVDPVTQAVLATPAGVVAGSPDSIKQFKIYSVDTTNVDSVFVRMKSIDGAGNQSDGADSLPVALDRTAPNNPILR